jgi:hypothetical protein
MTTIIPYKPYDIRFKAVVQRVERFMDSVLAEIQRLRIQHRIDIDLLPEIKSLENTKADMTGFSSPTDYEVQYVDPTEDSLYKTGPKWLALREQALASMKNMLADPGDIGDTYEEFQEAVHTIQRLEPVVEMSEVEKGVKNMIMECDG